MMQRPIAFLTFLSDWQPGISEIFPELPRVLGTLSFKLQPCWHPETTCTTIGGTQQVPSLRPKAQVWSLKFLLEYHKDKCLLSMPVLWVLRVFSLWLLHVAGLPMAYSTELNPIFPSFLSIPSFPLSIFDRLDFLEQFCIYRKSDLRAQIVPIYLTSPITSCRFPLLLTSYLSKIHLL